MFISSGHNHWSIFLIFLNEYFRVRTPSFLISSEIPAQVTQFRVDGETIIINRWQFFNKLSSMLISWGERLANRESTSLTPSMIWRWFFFWSFLCLEIFFRSLWLRLSLKIVCWQVSTLTDPTLSERNHPALSSENKIYGKHKKCRLSLYKAQSLQL